VDVAAGGECEGNCGEWRVDEWLAVSGIEASPHPYEIEATAMKAHCEVSFRNVWGCSEQKNFSHGAVELYSD
jgi:hypothetical protein